MPASSARFMLTVPINMAKRAEEFKKTTYSDKSYAEMYRELIKIGMEVMDTKKDRKNDRGTA